MRILIGFDDINAENAVKQAMAKRGAHVHYEHKYTKASIKEYVDNHKDCSAVLLIENGSQGKYSAEEIAELTDVNDSINVVILLDERHKGTDFMKILYAAGINNAVFHPVGKKGVEVSLIADMLCAKRTKAAARKYYGIDDSPIIVNTLSESAIAGLLHTIQTDKRKGQTLLARYINVATNMTPHENAELIRKMPTDMLDELKRYSEFFDVVDSIERSGLSLNICKPRKVIATNTQRFMLEQKRGIDMNLNDAGRNFERESFMEGSKEFSSIPMMQQANRKMEQDFSSGSRQSMFNTDYTAAPVSSEETYGGYENSPMNEYGNSPRRIYKTNEPKKRSPFLYVGIGIFSVIFLAGIFVVTNSLLSTKEGHVSKAQQIPETVSTVVEETETGITSDIAGEDILSKADTSVSEPVTAPGEENLVSEEGAVSSESEPVVDITTIINDGCVINQQAVDNIMAMYKEKYTFVVYALSDNTAGTSQSIQDTEGAEENGDGEAVAEDTPKDSSTDKYYRVSLEGTDGIVFTQISHK